jgi:hypothetical protein
VACRNGKRTLIGTGQFESARFSAGGRWIAAAERLSNGIMLTLRPFGRHHTHEFDSAVEVPLQIEDISADGRHVALLSNSGGMLWRTRERQIVHLAVVVLGSAASRSWRNILAKHTSVAGART